MTNEISIEVKNLTISYRSLKSYSIKKSLLHLKKDEKDYFDAVKDVSFTVNKGEILGIIGKNGSGKSTLLRAIGGVFAPDKGEINLFDNSISLSAIGVGFKQELTGRENIILSGMLLGFSEDLMKEKQQKIIEFADIGDFIDKPVRTYSSGMHSKLAFSITATLETDIMLIDEVLSVGDQSFKKKSQKKMLELINADHRTVIIVSHSLSTLQDLCNRIMWIDGGVIKQIGDTEEVLKSYVEYMK